MSYLDLKQSGPLVVSAPPHVIGMLTDFFQRTLTEVGWSGPDRAEGGLYLLVPPDYQGPLPAGYYTFRSPTYNVFLFFRTVLTQGPDGPDAREPVALAEMTRVYPWGSLEKDRPAMQFPNASNVPVNMMYPTDFSYWRNSRRSLITSRWTPLRPKRAAFWRQSGSSRAFRSTPMRKPATA